MKSRILLFYIIYHVFSRSYHCATIRRVNYVYQSIVDANQTVLLKLSSFQRITIIVTRSESTRSAENYSRTEARFQKGAGLPKFNCLADVRYCTLSVRHNDNAPTYYVMPITLLMVVGLGICAIVQNILRNQRHLDHPKATRRKREKKKDYQ